MNHSRKLFVDTGPLICFLEKNPDCFETLKDFFSECPYQKINLVTSVMTIEEYLVYPIRMQRHDLIAQFNDFLELMHFQIVNINKRVAVCAAHLRAEYPSLGEADAFQLAAAIENGCQQFLTLDERLGQQCSQIQCILPDNANSSIKQ